MLRSVFLVVHENHTEGWSPQELAGCNLEVDRHGRCWNILERELGGNTTVTCLLLSRPVDSSRLGGDSQTGPPREQLEFTLPHQGRPHVKSVLRGQLQGS